MAIHADFVFEVRTTGNDTNGGGYKSSAGTTDYSQQDAAQLSLTDCATSGTTVTTLTSATGGFTSAMVGNAINLSAGTNLTTGIYEITGYTDTNTVTLDRAPDDGVGGVSGATGKVGGAFASPGKLSDVTFTTTGGNKVWIKSGTYTITTSTAGPAGPVTLSANDAVEVTGYNATRGDLEDTIGSDNRPVISAGSVGTITIFNASTGNDNGVVVSHIVVDGNSQTAITGISGYTAASAHVIAYDCKAINCSTEGFKTLQASYCWAQTTSGTRGFNDCPVDHCVSIGATTCFYFYSSDYGFNCIASGGTTGYAEAGSAVLALVNCIADGCSGDGFNISYFDMTLSYCVATNCGGYAFNQGTANYGIAFVRCAHYNCTSGRANTGAHVDLYPITLTADPWEDAAAYDFTPNNATGGGKLLREKLKMPGHPLSVNIGAVQHPYITGYPKLVTLDPPISLDFLDQSGSGYTSDYTLNAANYAYAAVFTGGAYKGGTVNKAYFYAGAVTTSGDVKVRVETIDSSGYPSGTLVTGASEATYNLTSTGLKEVTLSEFTISQGDRFAVVVKNPASSFADWQAYGIGANYDPFSAEYNGTSWATGTRSPIQTLGFNDGSVLALPYGLPNSSSSSTHISSASTPDEVGLLINVPFACRVCGVSIPIDADSDYDVVLYDKDSTAISTSSFTSNDQPTTNHAWMYVMFDTPLVLAANENCRITVKPSSGTGCRWYYNELSSAAEKAVFGGIFFSQTERTDAGAWTDTETKVPYWFPVIDRLSDNVHGGISRSHPLAHS